MGGSVSAGRDNNELIDNLVSGNYIRSRAVERVFRALDRGDYMTPEARRQAYKDLAWREGLLHMSSPCIYSEVMEGLELKPGLSFLNIGSGTGYLSTLAGLILGTSGISHGVEIYPSTVEYATIKLQQFIKKSSTLDYFDFCEPKFFIGNGLNLAPLQSGYDRVYCGAGCPEKYVNYIRYLLKVGGILVVPIKDTLQQVLRISETKWVSSSLMSVSFATLKTPTNEDLKEHIRLADIEPPRLVSLARARIRDALRDGVLARRPELRDRPLRRPTRRVYEPRRVIIPIDSTLDNENLNVLHDLDAESGANEMNALLSLVISMGGERLAGALQFGSDRGPGHRYRHDRDSRSSHEDDDDSDGSTETVEPTTEGNDQSIENEDDTGSRSNHESREDSEDSTHKTDARDKSDNSQAEAESIAKSNDEIATDSQSDTSSVGKPKKSRQRARRSRRLAKLRLGEKHSRHAAGTRPSTSKDDRSEKHDSVAGSCDSDDNEQPQEVKEDDTSLEAGPSTDMEWQDLKHPKETKNGVRKSKAKRQKLDSGIGENSGSAEDSSPSEASACDFDPWARVDLWSAEGRESAEEDAAVKDEVAAEEGAVADEDAAAEEDVAAEEDAVAEEDAAAEERRARRKSLEARRREMASAMRHAVAALPLPHPLKIYVNWGRPYQL